MSEQKPPVSEYADDFLGDNERSRVLANLSRQSPRARTEERERNANRPSQCPRCGSTWFFEVMFNQYRADSYGSAPGGGLEVVSTMQQGPIAICLCGAPLEPNIGGAIHGGRTPNENMESFKKSFQAAIRFLDTADGDPNERLTAAIETALRQGPLAELIEQQGKTIDKQAKEIQVLDALVGDLKLRFDDFEKRPVMTGLATRPAKQPKSNSQEVEG